jgi:polyhydroxyalkanoate synthesis regulator phasin
LHYTKGDYKKMKRIKIVLLTGLVAVMLSASLPFIALAQENAAPQGQGALITRVSEILGIDQQKLEDAIKQARGELPKSTVEDRLSELVANGTLTQQQADEIKTWVQSKPTDIPNVRPAELKKLLDAGKITQQQVDALKAWLKARPDMPQIRPELLKERAQKIQENRDALLTRVADILGIDKQTLENAFKQAQSELRENALDTRLQQLVKQGSWTQQQADAYKAWIKARPDVPPLRLGPTSGQPQ